MKIFFVFIFIIYSASLSAQTNSVYARDTLNMGTPNLSATNKTKWIRVTVAPSYGHNFGIGRGQNDTIQFWSPLGTLIKSAFFINKDTTPIITNIASNYLLSLDTNSNRVTRILPSNLGFATGNTLYTGDGTATNRTVTVSGFINYIGGKIKIGSITDQGSFTLQNTGGFYQNGTFSLNGTLSAPGTYTILVKNTSGSDSNIYQIPSSTFISGNTIYTGNGALSGNRQILGAGYDLNLGTTGSQLGNATINSNSRISLLGQIWFNQKTAPDANYLVGSELTIRLPQITANRILSIGTTGVDSGYTRILYNENNSNFKWSLNQSLVFPSGWASNDLDNQTSYLIQAIGNGTTADFKVLAMSGTPPVIVSSASTLNITYSNYSESTFVGNGTTATYTLPAIRSDRIGYTFYIKNRGSGNITINTNLAGNDIYDIAPVNSIIIPAGNARVFKSDGTYFILQ